VRTLVILAAAATLWQSLIRDTNSHAASARAANAYAQQKYEVAAREFRTASSIAPSPRTSFNLGTAQVAAGRRAEGSATLSEAMRAPLFRPDALYNRGNSALAAKAYEHAVRDYTDALRLRSGDVQAKRNLEIALSRLESMRQQQQQQSGGAQQQPQQGGSQPPQPQPTPSARPEGQRQEADTEALLRSVQQQEQEELARMKRARAGRVRVGW
jgi:tetratricopeptide (TPR) repeat protein